MLQQLYSYTSLFVPLSWCKWDKKTHLVTCKHETAKCQPSVSSQETLPYMEHLPDQCARQIPMYTVALETITVKGINTFATESPTALGYGVTSELMQISPYRVWTVMSQCLGVRVIDRKPQCCGVIPQQLCIIAESALWPQAGIWLFTDVRLWVGGKKSNPLWNELNNTDVL